MQQPKFWTVVLIFIVLQMDFKTILCSVTVFKGIMNLSKLNIHKVTLIYIQSLLKYHFNMSVKELKIVAFERMFYEQRQ